MKFFIVYSAFSLLAAAMPAVVPLEQDLAVDSEMMVSPEPIPEPIPEPSPLDDGDDAAEKPPEKPAGKGKGGGDGGGGGGKGKGGPKGGGGGGPPKGDAPKGKGKGDGPKGGGSPKGSGGGLGGLLGGGTRCGPVAVLFSRGTFEVGAQGMAVGSPFTTALQAVLPAGTVFWGNEYVNDVVGYLTGGSVQGSMQMRNKAQEFVDKCPGIKLVLGGYSQGAQVTHHALEQANAKTKAQVKAVVLFGDPLSGRPIPGISKDRVKTICAAGDTICWGLPVVTIAHMVYGATDSVSAAAWVKSKINT